MFIKELNLTKVDGFEDDENIEFNNKQKELIDFYLKNVKKIKEGEKDIKLSDRIQINCILGGNGAGKTKLLSNIMHFLKRNQFDLDNEKSIKFSHIEYKGKKRNEIVGEEIKFKDKNNIKAKITDKISVIYDDFFVGSDMFNHSIHEELLGNLYYRKGLNDFYCDVYNFLQKETHKGIFSNFLNINKYNRLLEIKPRKNFQDKIDNSILFFDFINSFIDKKYKEEYKNLYNIFDINLIYKIIYLLGNEISIKLNGEKLGKSKLDFNKGLVYLRSFYNYINALDRDFLIKDLKFNLYYSENYDAMLSKCISNIKTKIFDYISKVESTKDINTLNLFEELEINEDYKLLQSYIKEFEKHIFFGEVGILSNSILFEKEIEILKDYNIDVNLKFQEKKDGKITQEKSFNHLSSGEKIMLIRFVNIYKNIIEENEKKGKKHFIILVDEPDLHLHLEWQQVYIQRLIDVFSTIPNDITMHFIIATHSPFIISDLPKENIIRLSKKDGKTKKDDIEKETFGANYIDIIRNGFFDGVFLGSFSKEIIGMIADKRRIEITNDEEINKEELEIIEKIEKQIGDEFLRDNLLYFKTKKDDKSGSK